MHTRAVPQRGSPDPMWHGLNNSDPAALVIDQTRDVVSHNKGKPPLLSTDDLVQPDAKLEQKKIEAPILFRGMAPLLHPVNNLEMKILPVSSSANLANLNTKSLKAPVAIGSAISFVPNMHARSTVHTLILGSLSMIHDRFSIRLEKSGNEQFFVEHERSGYTSLFLSRQITLWPLEMHSVPPLQNTIGWWCIHVTINSSSLEDHIGCKASPGTEDDGVAVSWRLSSAITLGFPVILSRDMSVRSTDTNVFPNNLLEFNLYEPRRDKTVERTRFGRRHYGLGQSMPVDKGRSSTSSRGSMAKEASSDNNDIDSVTALMSEEYAEEAELASLADDVVSSHSSLAASSASGSLALPNGENGSGLEKENHAAPSKHGLAKVLLFIYGTPCKYTTPLQGLSAWTSTNYQPGCVNVACATAQIDDAKKAAAAADATVLIVGADQSIEAESRDQVDLLLPGQQQLLVTEVAKAPRGPLIIVIMSRGRFDISSAKDDDKVSRILWVGYPGEAGEAAISPQRFDEENSISILDEILMIIQDDIDCYSHLSKGATTWVPEVWPIKKDAVFVSRLHSCGIILIGKAIMHESYCGVVPTVVIFEYVTAGWTRENTACFDLGENPVNSKDQSTVSFFGYRDDYGKLNGEEQNGNGLCGM
ncbi:hypothetical protein Nepgr_027305 [Nepenthes gracilis]|uniref:Glycoside hydrolase family 3 C-terminal domain-containing protein n=1 Tax=Nepenthes gracilis TaxID=150966 RepID=A0AAD3T9T2_NEPGR|nr:hypothetical protein Nepgr_027305 [Nepenthes gracilis]